MNIAMIGSGYVGLVSGACFADFGHIVTCVDNDPSIVSKLKDGQVPIYEPGLQELVSTNIGSRRLVFTTDVVSAVKNADVIFIAVGTPMEPESRNADMRFVHAAASDIAAGLEGFKVIVTKSTVPVGTGDEIENIIRKLRPDAEFEVVSNPEFLREGAAIEDFKRPNRIIIGTESEKAKEIMSAVYRPLNINQPPIVFMSRRAAELTKYAANAFLATKITFINEIADLCEKIGADVQQIARGIGLDNRIGSKFLHAGPGYGGSCFPKDTMALVHTAQEAGSPMRIVETVAEVNAWRKKTIANRIIAACGGSVRGKSISILGLAFKPNTDDMRESPSLDIVEAIKEAGGHVSAYDPEAMKNAKPLMPDVTFCEDPYDCAEGASALVLVTEWDSFRALDLKKLKNLLREPVVVDFRNIYRPEEMRAFGFRYHSIGRP